MPGRGHSRKAAIRTLCGGDGAAKRLDAPNPPSEGPPPCAQEAGVAIFSVFYKATKKSRFDHAYYDEIHVPLLKEAFKATGLSGVLVLKGVSAGDGGAAPYVAMAHLSFDSPEALQASLTGPRAAEVLGDIAKFTDIKPLTQISTRSQTAAAAQPAVT